MFRTFTLIFYHEPDVTHSLIGVMAGITIVAGCMGAIAFKDVRQIVAYNVVIAVGFILIGLAVATPASIEGSIYYIIHDMIAKAMLFLLVGTMILLTGKNKIDEISGLIRNYPMFGWLFFFKENTFLAHVFSTCKGYFIIIAIRDQIRTYSFFENAIFLVFDRSFYGNNMEINKRNFT